VLEEVRLLSGVETTKEKVLRIILAGQPELHAKLDSDELIQLRQRVRLRFHLTALTESEMGAYILHRLNVAGAEDREIFEPDTFPLIFRYTGGIPRLVNTLCDTCLLSAFGSNVDKIDVEIVRQVLGELQWQEYAGRTHTDLPVATRVDDTSPQPCPPVGRVVLSKRGVTLDHALLVPGRFIIGRTTDNDMQIDSKFVSRHHMQLITSVDSCYVEDLNSTNGVFLNGKRVRRHKLQPGDVIKLGMHEVTYSRLDQRVEPGDGLRATRTAVLQDSDLDSDPDADDEESDADDEERDESTYSSTARGS
jgi:general secretion pathway protein A